MSSKEEEFLKSLRATFKVEAAEHLQAIAAGLLELERVSAPEGQRQLIETVFRAAHSLKGAARAVNFAEIEAICQSVENMFAAWKREEGAPSPQALDTVHRALDAVTGIIGAPEVQRDRSEPAASAPLSPVSTPTPSDNEPGGFEKSHAGETVRIGVGKLDARLLEAEEMLAAKLAVTQRASDLRNLADYLEGWTKEWTSVQPEMRRFRQISEGAVREAAPNSHLIRLADFLDWNQEYVRSLQSKVAVLSRTMDQDRLAIGKLVDDLLEDSKKLLMLPLATLGAILPKVVRDLCRDQGKEADLVMRGGEVELDKRILEEMKDPLIHLLRNCVDHGVERPEQRQREGKAPRATIALTVSPVSENKVELVVSDDGAGIDVEKVKDSAVKHGFLSPEEAASLTPSEARALIFRAGVSTSAMITQLSGRGLGMAIVREKAEKLGGRVSVESAPRVGTTIRIALPVTLATFRGILVEAAERLFVAPTAQVERVTRFTSEDVQTVEGQATLSLNGQAVALVRLSDVLELPSPRPNGEQARNEPAIVFGLGDQRVAFAVDAVLGEQEVLVKRLNKPLARVRNIAGATVLGTGRIAPILNVADLLKSARKAGGAARLAAGPERAVTKAKAILVAEDSITSRMLLKSILESAGYQVKTAVDGVEAFTHLRADRFDLVVSDVEMPRMNGFDLTARIRADKKLAELPVVLVTALETREDRERGIDVGANAYLIKSSFDQSNLLEAVHRLV